MAIPRLFRLLVVAIVMAIPTAAWACPSCAGNEGGYARIVLMFVMIFLPFVIAYVAYRFIRKAGANRPPQLGRYL